MQFTLRKAHRVVKELQTKLSLSFETKAIHRTSSSDIIGESLLAVQKVNADVVKKSLLVQDAISDIRTALQAANSLIVDGNSVDSLLSRKVQIESQMRILQLYRAENKKTDAEVLSEVIQEIADINVSPIEYRQAAKLVGNVSPSQHNEFNKQYVALKKEQESVSDTLAYINNKLTIELDDKYSDLLTKLQIV